VLYEDSQVQISVKSEYHGHQGRLAIYISNKLTFPMSQISVQTSDHDSFLVNVAAPHQHTIAPGAQVQRLVQVECRDAFSEPPSLFIGFNDQMLHLRLPVVLTKFQEPVEMDGQSFFKRWNQIGGPPRENQAIFNSPGPIKLDQVGAILRGFRFGLLQGVDPNANNFVGVGIISAGAKGGKIGALLRLEPNMEQNVREMAGQNSLCLVILIALFLLYYSMQMYRLTVRTPSETVSEHIRSILQQSLANGL
jgi:AP-2 complex subunit alpha